ncbi:hypothetical protein ACIFOT_00800 [Neobacillus sp. NRS-1170]|uniref:hypothetical protein n=1 Tax=Neobacillus sp. NRS-1170 TaxID=3233898 RepID=UPI003D2745B0
MIVFPFDPLRRVEGGDSIVEGRHVADVCPQPTIPDQLDDLTKLRASGVSQITRSLYSDSGVILKVPIA